jgi:hypothetical protein
MMRLSPRCALAGVPATAPTPPTPPTLTVFSQVNGQVSGMWQSGRKLPCLLEPYPQGGRIEIQPAVCIVVLLGAIKDR